MTNLAGGALPLGDSIVPFAEVRVDNAPLPPAAMGDVVAVTVHQDVELPGMFALRLLNWDLAAHAITWSDSTLFALGAAVTIAVGYRGAVPTTVFAGEVTALEPEFNAGEAPTLVVRGYDRRHRLMRGRHTRTFTSVT